jgi:tRNA A-37 threonylcarbamoyl transferase component Bud32
MWGIVATTGAPSRVIGRYQLFDEIASGGMATVHFGRMTGVAGFARTVAIKRLHPQYAKSPEFVAMLIDEARLAARIRHPNVVSTLDIVAEDGEMLLVMDYVQGVTLSHLLRDVGGELVPPPIAVGIITGALYGLHAAHEATSETGEPLHVVHRDVSPQNIIVGNDGVPRVADFGIAKAAGRLQTTQDGHVKGKTAYMAPEQIRQRTVDRRADVYAAGVVLWETLSGRRLFTGDSTAAIMNAVLDNNPIPSILMMQPDVPPEIDGIIAKAMSRDPGPRFGTAREMAVAIEAVLRPASAREIGEWIEVAAAGTLGARAKRVASIEASSTGADASPISAIVEVGHGAGEIEVVVTNTGHVSDAVPVPGRRGRLALPLAIAAVAIVGVVGAIQLVGRHPSVPAAPSVSVPLAPVPLPVPSASAPPSASSGPVVAPSASSPPAPTAPSRARPVSPRAPPLNCNPPYMLDANGTRHWKNGC